MGMTAHPHPHRCCSQFLPSWLLFQWGEWCRRQVVVDVEQRVTCQIVTIASIVSKNSIKLNLKLRKTHPSFEGKRLVETSLLPVETSLLPVETSLLPVETSLTS
jgi:hypothetical protein